MNKIYTRAMLLKRHTKSYKRQQNKVLGKKEVSDRIIIAFTEEHSSDAAQGNSLPAKSLVAHELFRIFTADIIKSNVRFIRSGGQ